MIRRVGVVVALLVGIATLAAPAHASTGGDLCSLSPHTAPLTRVQVGHDGDVTTKVLVTHTLSVCNPSVGTWIVVSQHMREWKRYNHDSGLACQMWARNGSARDGTPNWSRWHDVPWGNATNC